MNRPLRSDAFEAKPAETLVGAVERVTFHNAETGFCVLQIRLAGRRLPVPLVACTPVVRAGAWVTARGHWQACRDRGLQFRAQSLATTPPTEIDGIARYLAAGLVTGIGPELAARIAARFGADTFAIIETAPSRLAEVPGIGPKRAAAMAESWRLQAATRALILFLEGHGIETGHAPRILRAYGDRALQVLTQDPFRVARDIRGIGFRTADALARRLGAAEDSPARLAAGVTQALLAAMNEGHCALDAASLADRVAGLLGIGRDPARIAVALAARDSTEIVADAIGDAPHIFLKGLHGAEQAIAARLLALADETPPWPVIDSRKAIAWVEQRIGRTLSASQRAAVGLVLRSKLCVLTGGPGVGKTATLDAILRILKAKGVRVALAAPTGRAAKRMAEQTGEPAATLHRLLQTDPRDGRFRRDAQNPLACDLLVIDEVSMVDVPLMRACLKALPEHAALLLVGDADQLPAIGPGQVLADLIASERVPVTHLDQVFRQAAQSRIVSNAHRIRAGRLPAAPVPGEHGDFHIVWLDDGRDAVTRLVSLVTRHIPARFGLDPRSDVQVLTPMQRGALGAQNLNAALQRALNPHPPVSIERFGRRYGTGDRVMVTRNDYEREVFNGDMGVIAAIDETNGRLVVDLDGRAVAFPLDDLDMLAPAYATTIHKAQGSEYPAVVMPVTLEARTMLARNLLYTGLTRGRQLVVLLAEREALHRAVRDERRQPRRTKLCEWLRAGVPDLRCG